MIFLVMFSLSPWISGVIGWAMMTGGGWAWSDSWSWLTGLATAAALFQWSVMYRFYGMSLVPSRYAITYPLGVLFCLAIVLVAMVRGHGSTTTWRGTTYRDGGVVSS